MRWPEIGKLRTARWVEAPYSASAGTSISPIESRSTRVAEDAAAAASLSMPLMVGDAVGFGRPPDDLARAYGWGAGHPSGRAGHGARLNGRAGSSTNTISSPPDPTAASEMYPVWGARASASA